MGAYSIVSADDGSSFIVFKAGAVLTEFPTRGEAEMCIRRDKLVDEHLSPGWKKQEAGRGVVAKHNVT